MSVVGTISGSALPFPLLTVLMECPKVWLRRRAASLSRML